MQRIVTLTTDFGHSDHYIGAMKGVILNIHPHTQIVDISNAVQSYDILDGALTIAQAYRYFPTDTLHIVIVDPGVGTSRRALIVRTEKHTFLAPDNGVLSLVYEREERLSVRAITADHYYLRPVSQTFHGRDVFAAIAGYICKGVELHKFGEEVTDFVRFAAPRPKPVTEKQLKGVVLKVDKFGNLVTNFSERDVPQLFGESPQPFKLTINKTEITSLRRTFAEGKTGEAIAIVGSMGFIEIVANRGSAAHVVGVGKGAEVGLAFGEQAAVTTG